MHRKLLGALLAGILTFCCVPAAIADEPLTAIDVLLLPDQTMVDRAAADNAKLRGNCPTGFELDAAHRPHITLLQRYVRTADLDKVFAAVERVLNADRPIGWQLEATAYYYLDFNDTALAGIVIRPKPELRALQQRIIDAVAPYAQPDGAASAFVTSAAEPDVNLPTVKYVNGFVPQQCGPNYNPHVTIGVGQIPFVQKMKAAPFTTFQFKIAGAAVFHLGNFGTAAQQLWAWQPSPEIPVSPSAETQSRDHDPLPSWNDGSTKRAIMDFVAKVTRPGTPDFVPVKDRIATFDNDGTLWCEMPIYVQFVFGIDRVKVLAPQHPEWRTTQPFKAALEGDKKAMLANGEKGLIEIMMAGHAGMTPGDFERIVTQWIATARHPRYNRPYTSLAYQPMLELLQYLRDNDFKTFIVSGGGIEFMRPWTDRVYGIPPYQVVGSSIKTEYELRGDTPILMRLPQLDFVDDKQGKPIGINRFIGQRPIAAFGNSDGDYEMLRWTTAGDGPRFGLIVHHTDAKREYAYDYPSEVGQLKRALDEAPQRGWTVVNMKDDWKTIFPSE